MSLLSCSLTVSVLDFQEPTVLVRCTILTVTGAITKGILVSLPATLSEQVSTIGSAAVEMLSSLLPMAMAITEDMDVGDGDE